MTVIFEWSGPWQSKPGRFKSRLMTRYWWGWWAVAVLHVSLPEFTEAEKVWVR